MPLVDIHFIFTIKTLQLTVKVEYSITQVHELFPQQILCSVYHWEYQIFQSHLVSSFFFFSKTSSFMCCVYTSSFTVDYWCQLLGMRIMSQSNDRVTLTYSENQVYDEQYFYDIIVLIIRVLWCINFIQANLELIKEPGAINHAEAFGRIAFSCPGAEVASYKTEMLLLLVRKWVPFTFMQLVDIETKVKESCGTILTPLVSLDTPGKATVEVVILADHVSLHMTLLFTIQSRATYIDSVHSTGWTWDMFCWRWRIPWALSGRPNSWWNAQ